MISFKASIRHVQDITSASAAPLHLGEKGKGYSKRKAIATASATQSKADQNQTKPNPTRKQSKSQVANRATATPAISEIKQIFLLARASLGKFPRRSGDGDAA